MTTPFDAIGFPTRGLSPDAIAERLAAWVRWPMDRGSARAIERAGKSLRVHVFEAGGGARLVTVVELKKRYFLPGEEIVCFFPAFSGGATRPVEVAEIETPACPWEPYVSAMFPERLRFRVTNPFDSEPAAGTTVPVAMTLLASRVEPGPETTRPMVMSTALATQDPELSPDLYSAVGKVLAVAEFVNSATGERVFRWSVVTPGGALEIVARAKDVPASPQVGDLAVAEGVLVGDVVGAPA